MTLPNGKFNSYGIIHVRHVDPYTLVFIDVMIVNVRQRHEKETKFGSIGKHWASS